MIFTFFCSVFSAKICLDPGFGGASSIFSGSRNSSIDNLRLSKGVGEILQKFGHTVYLVRTHLGSVTMTNRVSFASYVGCDIYYSLKRNAADTSKSIGIETRTRFFYSRNDMLLRNNTLNAIQSVGMSPIISYKTTMNETVLTNSPCPAAQIYLLFISNRRENLLFDEFFFQWCDAIANSLIETYKEFD